MKDCYSSYYSARLECLGPFLLMCERVIFSVVKSLEDIIDIHVNKFLRSADRSKIDTYASCRIIQAKGLNIWLVERAEYSFVKAHIVYK